MKIIRVDEAYTKKKWTNYLDNFLIILIYISNSSILIIDINAFLML